ncbi:MAG: Hsp20/alpha crystallin family protein [Candidatus Binatia bacterium]
MRSIYRNPMREIAEAERRFSSFFQNNLAQKPSPEHGSVNWSPAVDVSENADAFVFTVELPGIKPEAVEIEVKDNHLTIKGKRQPMEPKDGVHVHHRERPSGHFARVFRLHKAVDAEKVTATYRDGLLEVLAPLRVEVKPRKIPVMGS